ncbi:hypothetical protein [Inquilinus sp. CAU 1745]|uniref:hypothetical protein n=1 Tax=Inquilinus sp. CAU 1745 TaxID=3140369 RepID=UPI00325AA33B
MNASIFQADSLIRTVSHLIEILDQEVQFLRAMQARDIGALQDRKLPLIEEYERQTAAIREDRSILETIDPILRDELRDVTSHLNVLIAENESALRAVTKANEKLLKTVIDTVQQQQTQTSGYGPLMTGSRATVSAPVSVQIDQRF